MKVINKPWGKEEWLELNDKYCYKRIYINAGYKTSLQYHEKKYETTYLVSGEAELWLENDEGIIEKKLIKAGYHFNVAPPKKHRIIAITDVITQEVSTPEVDDVIRIEDDSHRKNGKIDSEHKNPAVLILAAGKGSRLGALCEDKNKALVSINNQAAISLVLERFPKDYDIVVALGYKKESLVEYLKLAHPDRNFIFVEIDKWEGADSGPGYSALCCKNHLQRPFYLVTADCLTDSIIPALNENWVGVSKTRFPEKYSTVKLNHFGNILEWKNKADDGFELAYIGLAGIFDYEIYWRELAQNIQNGENISAWSDPTAYPSLKAKELNWFDTGNLESLEKTRKHFTKESVNLIKDTKEVTYKIRDVFLKFHPNPQVTFNRARRAERLNSLIPASFQHGTNFISYKWNQGETLYTANSIEVWGKFLRFYGELLDSSEKYYSPELIRPFYQDKTIERLKGFATKYGDRYLDESITINGNRHDSISNIFKSIDFSLFQNNPFYSQFHGDLHFDNLLFDKNTDKFIYIDWRESFAGSTKGGDIYYDLAKFYGGLILPYHLLKNDDYIILTEDSKEINYELLKEFKTYYENWLVEHGFYLGKVKLITGLIFLSMSPLHTEKFNKLLLCKGIEILS